MSLANRLNSVVPGRANAGCCTCKWLAALKVPDRRAFDRWIVDGHSKNQLYEICTHDDPPLTVSLTGFRAHLRHHKAIE